MGSYSECWLGDFYVGSIRNDFDWFLMSMFRPEDKKIVTAKNELPHQLSRWSDIFDEDDNPSVVFYSTPARIVRDRLELSGYTLKASINSFNRWRVRKIDQYEQRLTFENEKLREYYDTEIAILRALNFEVWMKNLAEIVKKRIKPLGNTHEVTDPLISYMLRSEWYGFPGWDISVVLRLVIDILPEQVDFTYDLTDLILSGYFDIDEDFANFSVTVQL